MSEKTQRTAASMRARMQSRYDDEFHHKHDKCHLPYRKHFRSHPKNSKIQIINGNATSHNEDVNCKTGHIREYNFRKTRKRQDRGGYH